MRRLVLLAFLALVPLAHGAAPPDYAEARSLLAIAEEHEQRALELLLKKPPREQAAVLRLTQSIETLDKLRVVVTAESIGPGTEVLSRVNYVRLVDEVQIERIEGPDPVDGGPGTAVHSLRVALAEKRRLAEVLRALQFAKPVPQCADGRDNDGDGVADAVRDAGCSSVRDATENSPFTCTLGLQSTATVGTLSGTCSGPFGRLTIDLPPSDAFATSVPPQVDAGGSCTQSSRRLVCTMLDGAQNPSHRVRVRFGVRSPLRGRPRVGFRTVNRRPLAWRSHRSRNVTGDTAAPASPPATSGVPLDFGLAYNHPSPNQGFSWVCVDVTAGSGALLTLTLTQPDGSTIAGNLQLKKKETATAHGTFSFKILSHGGYQVRVDARVGGKSASKSKSINVTGAPGSPGCGP